MARDEFYNEYEQAQAVKKWLQENGSAIVLGLALAFGGIFGFKQWQGWQLNQKQRASAEFEVMSQLLADDQLDAAMANYQTLRDEFEDSPYASMAALQMARARLEADQPDLAITLLQFVADNGTPRAVSLVGRVRLARVLLDQGRTDEAMATLDAAGALDGFEAAYAEARGDILVAMGEQDEAIASYRKALDTLEEGAGDRTYLELKLKSLGADPVADAQEDGAQS